MTRKVIIIRETVRQSYKRDGASVLGTLALILPGHLLSSSALLFIGLAALLLITLRWAVGKSGEMTVDEARALLDEIEANPDPDA